MQPKSGQTTTNAAGPDMKRRTKNLLTTLIVLTLTAIFVVGFVLVWDVFLRSKVDRLFNTDFYAVEKPLYLSDTKVNLSSTGMAQLGEKERLLIENYFTCYYAGLGSFYHEDLSRFYDFECIDRFYDELAYDFEITAAKRAAADCSFDECNLEVYLVNRRTTNEGTAVLEVRVSAEVTYGFSPLKTTLSDENHIFTVNLVDEPLIKKHTTDRLSRKYADGIFTDVIAEKGYIPSDISYTYYYPYAEEALDRVGENCKTMESRLNRMLTMKRSYSFTAEYDYDRFAACEYGRNSEGHSGKFGSYDENDANFCSQCLIAGGIPMDAQSDRLTQWKWYDYEENNAREHSGCTKSWYDRRRFRTYAKENTGFGLVAQITDFADPGDIIQLTYTPPYRDSETEIVLQCVVTGTVLDKNNAPVDYLICTDKIKNKPLSLLWNGDMEVISIIGYNTANI